MKSVLERIWKDEARATVRLVEGTLSSDHWGKPFHPISDNPLPHPHLQAALHRWDYPLGLALL